MNHYIYLFKRILLFLMTYSFGFASLLGVSFAYNLYSHQNKSIPVASNSLVISRSKCIYHKINAAYQYRHFLYLSFYKVFSLFRQALVLSPCYLVLCYNSSRSVFLLHFINCYLVLTDIVNITFCLQLLCA